MARHRPGIVWSLRRKALGYEWVRTHPDGGLDIRVSVMDWWQVDGDRLGVQMDRATARLLARRIQECLEATK